MLHGEPPEAVNRFCLYGIGHSQIADECQECEGHNPLLMGKILVEHTTQNVLRVQDISQGHRW